MNSNLEDVTKAVRDTCDRLTADADAFMAEVERIEIAVQHMERNDSLRVLMETQAIRLRGLASNLMSARTQMHWMGLWGTANPENAVVICEALRHVAADVLDGKEQP